MNSQSNTSGPTADDAINSNTDSQWITVCDRADLNPDAGICALIEGHQVAIFYLQRQQMLYAVANYDPIGQANVISRGIIGSVGDRAVVASPLYKQHFDLVTGQCLEQPEYCLSQYQIRIVNDEVQVRSVI